MLSGKVALVTGAAQGIGYAIASTLISNGAKVGVVEVNDDAGRAACVELEKTYGPNKVLFVQCDVTDKDKLRTAFQQTVAAFGKVDIVCNNAGVCNEANWRKNIEIDLIALIEGTNLGIEFMSTKSGGNGGHILNIASIAGLMPYGIIPTYCAAKAGVIHFTRSLKDLSVSDGIFVNCICPDTVDTPMIRGLGPLTDVLIAKELLRPSDVAECVLQILRDSPSGAAMKLVVNEGRSYVTFPPELCAPELPK